MADVVCWREEEECRAVVGDILAEGVETGKVERGAEAGAEGRRESAAPETTDGVWRGEDCADGREEGRGLAGLLDAGFQEVCGLEEDGGGEA